MIFPVNYIAIVRGFNLNKNSKNYHKGIDLGWYSKNLTAVRNYFISEEGRDALFDENLDELYATYGHDMIVCRKHYADGTVTYFDR